MTTEADSAPAAAPRSAARRPRAALALLIFVGALGAVAAWNWRAFPALRARFATERAAAAGNHDAAIAAYDRYVGWRGGEEDPAVLGEVVVAILDEHLSIAREGSEQEEVIAAVGETREPRLVARLRELAAPPTTGTATPMQAARLALVRAGDAAIREELALELAMLHPGTWEAQEIARALADIGDPRAATWAMGRLAEDHDATALGVMRDAGTTEAHLEAVLACWRRARPGVEVLSFGGALLALTARLDARDRVRIAVESEPGRGSGDLHLRAILGDDSALAQVREDVDGARDIGRGGFAMVFLGAVLDLAGQPDGAPVVAEQLESGVLHDRVLRPAIRFLLERDPPARALVAPVVRARLTTENDFALGSDMMTLGSGPTIETWLGLLGQTGTLDDLALLRVSLEIASTRIPAATAILRILARAEHLPR